MPQSSENLIVMTPAGQYGKKLPDTPENFKRAKAEATSLVEKGLPWVQVMTSIVPPKTVFALDASQCPAPCGR